MTSDRFLTPVVPNEQGSGLQTRYDLDVAVFIGLFTQCPCNSAAVQYRITCAQALAVTSPCCSCLLFLATATRVISDLLRMFEIKEEESGENKVVTKHVGQCKFTGSIFI